MVLFSMDSRPRLGLSNTMGISISQKCGCPSGPVHSVTLILISHKSENVKPFLSAEEK
jgi:hypothetical protein